MRFRVSIATLLGLVAAAGLALAAFRSASQLWANVAFSAALAGMTVSVLAAVYRRGRRRAFWVGSSACGWAYLVLNFAPWFDVHVSPNLATTTALDLLNDRIYGPSPLHPPGSPFIPISPVYEYTSSGHVTGVMATRTDAWSIWTGSQWSDNNYLHIDRTTVVSTVRFRRIGHSLFALMAACAGGLVAMALHASGERSGDDRPSRSASSPVGTPHPNPPPQGGRESGSPMARG